MQAIVAILLLLASFSLVESQPISHQNWQTMTISGDAINIECAPLLLPIELGRLLIENDPLQEPRGEMDQALRSSHAVKVSLQPETGTSDQLTSITGCTTNGARLQLSTVDTGDTITIVHTPGSIEFFGGSNVVLSSPTQILTLQRKAGIWVSDGGLGGAGGNMEDFSTACPQGMFPMSDGEGGVDCWWSVIVDTDCSIWVNSWDICIDWDSGGKLYVGDGTTAQRANPIHQAADCSPYAEVGDLCIDTDDAGFYKGTGTEVISVAGGVAGSQSLDSAFDNGKVIDGANSQANAVSIGNGTAGIRLYAIGSDAFIECFSGADTCDVVVNIQTGKSFHIKYAGTDGIAIDSNGEVTLSNNLIEYRTYWFGAGELSTDETNCTVPAEHQINGGPKLWTIQCGNNSSSIIYGNAGMPDSYNGGTVKFRLKAVNENAGASGNLSISFSAMCRTDGDSINAVWGTPVSMTTTFTAQYVMEYSNAITVTPQGSCAGGEHLFWKATLNASPSTTTQMANVYILGAKMEYPTNTWSDD